MSGHFNNSIVCAAEVLQHSVTLKTEISWRPDNPTYMMIVTKVFWRYFIKQLCQKCSLVSQSVFPFQFVKSNESMKTPNLIADLGDG